MVKSKFEDRAGVESKRLPFLALAILAFCLQIKIKELKKIKIKRTLGMPPIMNAHEHVVKPADTVESMNFVSEMLGRQNRHAR